MKTLNQYIDEALHPEEMFLTAITNNKFTQEQILNMLLNMDMKDIKKLSDSLKTKYSNEYFSYEPSKDEFLKKSDKEKICNKISNFLLNFVCKK